MPRINQDSERDRECQRLPKVVYKCGDLHIEQNQLLQKPTQFKDRCQQSVLILANLATLKKKKFCWTHLGEAGRMGSTASSYFLVAEAETRR